MLDNFYIKSRNTGFFVDTIFETKQENENHKIAFCLIKAHICTYYKNIYNSIIKTVCQIAEAELL